ncbi:MAG: DMT family transporter [Casimicrobiaceae bacterium]
MNAALQRADIARLLALGAIWGSSFIFVRVLAPLLGPWATAASRVALGGMVLVAYAMLLRRQVQLRRFWVAYAGMGLVNSAIPFTLFGFAALHLPASYLGILNSTTPLFAALLASVWLDEPLTRGKLAGLGVGCAGVILVSGAGPVTADAMFGWAIAASLVASFCYAASGIWLRRTAPEAPALAVAGWSQLAAAAMLAPMLAIAPWPIAPGVLRDPVILADIVALAVVCSAAAYLLYYRLLQDVGPTRTFTVTFLIPLFGMLWAALFLRETITPVMVVGCGLIISGTFTVLRPPTPRPRTA